MRLRLLALTCLTLLAACDQLGIESPQKELERKEADAKAVGSACRQAGRAIEDCYNLNPKASKSAVFGGWREMDEYMRENKLDIVTPTVPPPSASKPKADDEADADTPDTPAKAASSANADGSASKDAGKDAGANHAAKKPRAKDKP